MGEQPPREPTGIPPVGWRAVLKRTFSHFKRKALTDRAAALTYFGVLALFPAALVLVALLGIAGENTADSLLDVVGNIAPGGVHDFLKDVIDQVQGRTGVASIAAVVGILLAIWSASAYVAAFMRASNAIYSVDEGRPLWKRAPVRLGVTIALLIMAVASVIIVVVTGSIATQVGRAIGLGDVALTIWNIAKWPVLLALVSLMFSLLYWACPNVKHPHPRFRWITPGGLVAVVAWLLASGAFALYVSFSGSYDKTYGSLATVIIFLVWLWVSNIAILLGAAFDAELEHQRAIQGGLPEDTEPFVEVRS